MPTSIAIVVSTELLQDHAQQRLRLDPNQSHEAARAVSKLFHAMAGGVYQGAFDVSTASAAPVAAGGSIAPTQANVDANDTVTIGGVVLTAKASGANGTTEFNKGANLAATCTNLAACINANTTLSKHLTATASSTAVAVAAKQKGSVSNLIVMSTSDATAFALTQLTGGAGGAEEAPVTFSLGL